MRATRSARQRRGPLSLPCPLSVSARSRARARAGGAERRKRAHSPPSRPPPHLALPPPGPAARSKRRRRCPRILPHPRPPTKQSTPIENLISPAQHSHASSTLFDARVATFFLLCDFCTPLGLRTPLFLGARARAARFSPLPPDPFLGCPLLFPPPSIQLDSTPTTDPASRLCFFLPPGPAPPARPFPVSRATRNHPHPATVLLANNKFGSVPCMHPLPLRLPNHAPMMPPFSCQQPPKPQALLAPSAAPSLARSLSFLISAAAVWRGGGGLGGRRPP